MIKFMKFTRVCEIKRFTQSLVEDICICISCVVYIAQSQSSWLQRIDPEERQIHDAKVGAAGFRGVLGLVSYNTLSQDRKMRSRPSRCIPLVVVFCSFFLNPSFLHGSFYSAPISDTYKFYEYRRYPTALKSRSRFSSSLASRDSNKVSLQATDASPQILS